MRYDTSQCNLQLVRASRLDYVKDILSSAATAAARAGGGLVRLTLRDPGTAFLQVGDGTDEQHIPPETVLSVCRAELLELRGATAASPIATQWTAQQLRRLAAASPALVVAELDVRVHSAREAADLFATSCGLRRTLRLRTLHVSPCASTRADEQWTSAALSALCAGAAAADVRCVHLFAMRSAFKEPGVLAALCAAVAASRLRRLTFFMCGLDKSSWRPLAAALAPHGGLEELTVAGDPVLCASAADVAPFLAALPAARLCRLHLELATGDVGDLGDDHDAAMLLLAAATGHATLRSIALRVCKALRYVPPREMGSALSAAAATLHDLDVGYSSLRDDAIAPLLLAITLPGCTLRRLGLPGCRMSAAFEQGPLKDAAEHAVLTLKELCMEDADNAPSGRRHYASSAGRAAQDAVSRRAVERDG